MTWRQPGGRPRATSKVDREQLPDPKQKSLRRYVAVSKKQPRGRWAASRPTSPHDQTRRAEQKSCYGPTSYGRPFSRSRRCLVRGFVAIARKPCIVERFRARPPHHFQALRIFWHRSRQDPSRSIFDLFASASEAAARPPSKLGTSAIAINAHRELPVGMGPCGAVPVARSRRESETTEGVRKRPKTGFFGPCGPPGPETRVPTPKQRGPAPSRAGLRFAELYLARFARKVRTKLDPLFSFY